MRFGAFYSFFYVRTYSMRLGHAPRVPRGINQNIKGIFSKERKIKNSCVVLYVQNSCAHTYCALSSNFHLIFVFDMEKLKCETTIETAFDQGVMKETTFCYLTPECKYQIPFILRQIAKLSLSVWQTMCIVPSSSLP